MVQWLRRHTPSVVGGRFTVSGQKLRDTSAFQEERKMKHVNLSKSFILNKKSHVNLFWKYFYKPTQMLCGTRWVYRNVLLKPNTFVNPIIIYSEFSHKVKKEKMLTVSGFHKYFSQNEPTLSLAIRYLATHTETPYLRLCPQKRLPLQHTCFPHALLRPICIILGLYLLHY